MELLTNYSLRGYNFTIWFFRILLAMFITMILLVVFMRINETVSIKDGEIVSVNPQADYKAPFEAQIVKVFVKEGQSVKAGDTLLHIKNLDYREQLAKTNNEIQYLQKKIESLSVLQDAVNKKKAALNETSEITSKKYQLDINRLVDDMKSMDEQHKLQKERLSSSTEKMAGDSVLYNKKMLSKYEYITTRDANLQAKENLNALNNQLNKQKSEKSLTYNNFTKEQNSLLLSKVQLEENTQSIVQTKIDFENQLLQAKEALKKLQAEIDKQVITASDAGIVNFLFNTKQSSNYLAKGDLLVSVAPQAMSHYAKLIVPEKDMPYVRTGLDARLKLDAYSTLQKGILKGKVTYVAERKENQQFYALVQIDSTAQTMLKSGYTVYGELVIERLPLYKYFIKKLFKKAGRV